jgi:hypothetical protein
LKQDPEIKAFENEVRPITEDEIAWDVHYTLSEIETALQQEDIKYLFE